MDKQQLIDELLSTQIVHSNHIIDSMDDNAYERMVAEICTYFGLVPETIRQKGKNREVISCKQMVVLFSILIFNKSLISLTRYCNLKNHTSMIFNRNYAIGRILSPQIDIFKDHHKNLCQLLGVDYDASIAKMKQIEHNKKILKGKIITGRQRMQDRLAEKEKRKQEKMNLQLEKERLKRERELRKQEKAKSVKKRCHKPILIPDEPKKPMSRNFPGDRYSNQKSLYAELN